MAQLKIASIVPSAITPIAKRITRFVRQTVDTGTPLPAVVDQLVDTQVAIAVLETREKNLKSEIISSGQTEVCGTNTRAVVSSVEAGTPIDYKTSFELAQKQLAELGVTATVVKGYKAGYDKVTIYGYN